MVFNKIDAYQAVPFDEEDLIVKRNSKHFSIEEWEKSWIGSTNGKALFISALTKTNLQGFRDLVYREVRALHIQRFPYNHFLYPEISE